MHHLTGNIQAITAKHFGKRFLLSFEDSKTEKIPNGERNTLRNLVAGISHSQANEKFVAFFGPVLEILIKSTLLDFGESSYSQLLINIKNLE